MKLSSAQVVSRYTQAEEEISSINKSLPDIEVDMISVSLLLKRTEIRLKNLKDEKQSLISDKQTNESLIKALNPHIYECKVFEKKKAKVKAELHEVDQMDKATKKRLGNLKGVE